MKQIYKWRAYELARWCSWLIWIPVLGFFSGVEFFNMLSNTFDRLIMPYAVGRGRLRTKLKRSLK